MNDHTNGLIEILDGPAKGISFRHEMRCTIKELNALPSIVVITLDDLERANEALSAQCQGGAVHFPVPWPTPDEITQNQTCDDCGATCKCEFDGPLMLSSKCCVHGEVECAPEAVSGGPVDIALWVRRLMADVGFTAPEYLEEKLRIRLTDFMEDLARVEPEAKKYTPEPRAKELAESIVLSISEGEPSGEAMDGQDSLEAVGLEHLLCIGTAELAEAIARGLDDAFFDGALAPAVLVEGEPVAWMVEKLEIKNGREWWTHASDDLVLTEYAAQRQQEHHHKLGFETRRTSLTHPAVGSEPVTWLSEMSESDVAGCHEITNDKPTHPDYHHGLHLRHRQLVGPWMVYDDADREIVAEDQSHRTCVSIDHCAARNSAAGEDCADEEWINHHSWVIRRIQAGDKALVLSQAKASLAFLQERL